MLTHGAVYVLLFNVKALVCQLTLANQTVMLLRQRSPYAAGRRIVQSLVEQYEEAQINKTYIYAKYGRA